MVTDSIKTNETDLQQPPAFCKPVLPAVKVGVSEIICKICSGQISENRLKDRKRVCGKCDWKYFRKKQSKRRWKTRNKAYKQRQKDKIKLWRKTEAGKKYLHKQYLRRKHKTRIYMREYMRKKRGSVIRNNEGELIIYRKKFKLEL